MSWLPGVRLFGTPCVVEGGHRRAGALPLELELVAVLDDVAEVRDEGGVPRRLGVHDPLRLRAELGVVGGIVDVVLRVRAGRRS